MARVWDLNRLFRTFLNLKTTWKKASLSLYSDGSGDCHVTLRVTAPGYGYKTPRRGGDPSRSQDAAPGTLAPSSSLPAAPTTAASATAPAPAQYVKNKKDCYDLHKVRAKKRPSKYRWTTLHIFIPYSFLGVSYSHLSQRCVFPSHLALWVLKLFNGISFQHTLQALVLCFFLWTSNFPCPTIFSSQMGHLKTLVSWIFLMWEVNSHLSLKQEAHSEHRKLLFIINLDPNWPKISLLFKIYQISVLKINLADSVFTWKDWSFFGPRLCKSFHSFLFLTYCAGSEAYFQRSPGLSITHYLDFSKKIKPA